MNRSDRAQGLCAACRSQRPQRGSTAACRRPLSIAAVLLLVFFALLAELLAAPLARATQPETAPDAPRPLMRFPDVHDGTVVFVYGEDIWSVPVEGGLATRLTVDDGEEHFPKFSPDGSLIAFTGEYDGNADIYVMTPEGGQITRVTWHPSYDEVVGWHPTSGKIIFSSRRHGWPAVSRLYMIHPDGTGLESIILHEAAFGCFSPDGSQIAYNRVSRENRTWKRYRGGTAQEIYLYDFATGEDRNLTNFTGTDRTPMWIGSVIYFSSDRDGILNLYGYDTGTGSIEQLTHHTDYDVRRPSMGGRWIVYELAGTLWLFDTESRATHQIPVAIGADAPEVRPYYLDVDEWLTDYELSPTGARALLVARGEIFTVPRENGPTRNLTNTSGAREKDAVWSPDGRWIAYLSDATGEYEVYLVEAQGGAEPVRLTQHASGYRHTLRWSPDSHCLGYTDQTLSLYCLDVASRRITKVDQADYENVDVALDVKPIFDFAWSPDSRYLAYTKMNADLLEQIYIHDLREEKTHCASDGLFNDFGPVFTPDGEHLLFVSNRRFDPTFCDVEWEMVYKQLAGIYSLTLRWDGPPLLPPRSDEEEPGTGSSGQDGGKRPTVNPRIDFDGLASRIEALPLARGNYRELAVADSVVFFLDREEGDFNRFEYRAIGPRTLYGFDLRGREEGAVIGDVDGYRLSNDGKYIIYRKDGAIGVIESSQRFTVEDARSRRVREEEETREGDEDEEDGQGDGERGPVHGELDLSNLRMLLDPRAEWLQLYEEAWRMERDFFYDPNLHGLDWVALGEKYRPLVRQASCRQDVRYIIGELIGELSTSHTYVGGGDRRREAEGVDVGLLGVDWERDAASNRYRFARILRVPDWTQRILPPLARPGVSIQPGDYLLALNGREITADRNIYSYFQDLAEQQVTLLVNNRPTRAGARAYVVETLRDEGTLRYLDWVEHNRQVVAEASNGKIGYLHLPDTYTSSAREFPKYFYAQTRKRGLIVDGRFNGGGLDPDIFLQRLAKPLLSYWTRRYSHDQTTPAVVTRAHLVCLTNRQAGSGGDMLPMEFQMRDLGPVVGTRSWGGLVGISMWIELVDGGGISAPDYRIYDPTGRWIVENEGVQPDIVVDLTPQEMARGYDAQLMKGVEVLLERIAADPRPWPKHEAYPVYETFPAR